MVSCSLPHWRHLGALRQKRALWNPIWPHLKHRHVDGLKGRAGWNVNPTIAPPLFKIASHNALLANTLTEVEGPHCHVCRADVVDVEGLPLFEIFLFILSILIS